MGFSSPCKCNFDFFKDWLAFHVPVSLILSISAGLRGRVSLGVNHEYCFCYETKEYGHVAETGMKMSIEGRVRACSCSRGKSFSCSGTLWSFSLACSLGKFRFAINLAGNLKFYALETICTFPNCAWDSHMIFPTKQLCKQKPVQRWRPCLR